MPKPYCASCGEPYPALVGTGEAAHLLGYQTTQGLRDLIRREQLPHIKRGKRFRFRMATLERLLELAEECEGSIPEAVRRLKRERRDARRRNGGR